VNQKKYVNVNGVGKMNNLDEGWIESYQIRNKEDCHPSHAIHVIKTEDVIGLVDAWTINHPKLLMRNDMKELIDELKKVIMRIRR